MRFNVNLSVAVAGACLLIAGCGDQPPAPTATATPHSVVAFPVSVQLAAGASAQLQAQANDQRERPIGGASIVFRSMDPDVIGVTQDGVISALGPVGISAVQVASGGRVVEVPVRIVAGAGALLEATRSPADAAPAAGLIGDVVVQLRDQFNNPVAGAALTWTLDERSGALESASATTAADGTGSAHWIAAATAGPQTLEVRSGNLPPLVLNARVTAGPPTAIQLRGDPPQEPATSMEVGDAIKFQAHVTDQHGNGVGGVEVGLTASGACKADPILQKTDAAGSTPASEWSMTVAGTCAITAIATDQPTLETRLTFRVNAAAKRK